MDSRLADTISRTVAAVTTDIWNGFVLRERQRVNPVPPGVHVFYAYMPFVLGEIAVAYRLSAGPAEVRVGVGWLFPPMPGTQFPKKRLRSMALGRLEKAPMVFRGDGTNESLVRQYYINGFRQTRPQLETEIFRSLFRHGLVGTRRRQCTNAAPQPPTL